MTTKLSKPREMLKKIEAERSSASDGPSVEELEAKKRDQHRIAGLAMGAIRQFKIAYLLPHSPQDLSEASPFGWYTPGLLQSARALVLAAGLPADIREPFASPHYQLIFRLNRSIWPLITPIQSNSLGEALGVIGTPFVVLLTSEPVAASDTDKLVSASALPLLHASSVPGPGRTSFQALTLSKLFQHVRRVLDQLSPLAEWEGFVKDAKRVIYGAPQRKARRHPLKASHHNVTAPNETALEAFGWYVTPGRPFSERFGDARSPQIYVDRIVRSADAVSEFRKGLLEDVHPGLTDYRYILAVTSVYWGHQRNISERVAAAPEQLRPALKKTLRRIAHPTTYYDELGPEDAGLRGSPVYHMLQEIRGRELKAFTASLASLAAGSLAPVLRLEPKVGNLRKEIGLLCQTVRNSAGPHHQWKASRIGRELGEKMRTLIAPEFLQRIEAPELNDHVEGMKLVCDAPLELLRIGGLALSLRFDTSRISPLPGNLSHQICAAPPIFLPLETFSTVLVLRSFATTDPVRPIFESAIHIMARQGTSTRVAYRFVDVSSPDDVVNAVSSFQGAVLVFDCHGSVDRSTGIGTLIIGGRPLDIWSLRKSCQLPPIVMFSACDTQPLDGAHGSVATAAFALGARAVLATTLPINAVQASIFNARMLLRLQEYVPVATRTRAVMTWREVTAGMLRMTYVIEAMMRLERFAGYPLEGVPRENVQFASTNAISARSARWHDVFVDAISSEASIEVSRVRRDLDRWCAFMDTHKYVQLGSPENVMIISGRLSNPGEEARDADGVH